jgi:hypothetical protein
MNLWVDRLVIQEVIILWNIREWKKKISLNYYVPVLRILRGWPICFNVRATKAESRLRSARAEQRWVCKNWRTTKIRAKHFVRRLECSYLRVTGWVILFYLLLLLGWLFAKWSVVSWAQIASLNQEKLLPLSESPQTPNTPGVFHLVITHQYLDWLWIWGVTHQIDAAQVRIYKNRLTYHRTYYIWNQFYMQIDGFTCKTARNYYA